MEQLPLMAHNDHADWLWEIVISLSTLLVFVIGWFCRIVWVKIGYNESQGKKTCNKLAALELKLAEEYVSVTTFKDSIREFKQDLHEHTKVIYEKLQKIDDHFMRK